MRATVIPSVNEIVGTATALAPILLQEAAETERLRQVPAATITRLREAGLYRLVVPRRFGGLETDLGVLARVIRELGQGCGATAWVYGVTAIHSWVAATFPQQAQMEIWSGGPEAVITGSYAPDPRRQKVSPVQNGFRLEGRWGFASGCDHADWHLLQFLAPSPAGSGPTACFALVPRSDFSIQDDWHAMGLAGTGSKAVILNDVFVPEHRVLEYRAMNEGDTPGGSFHGNLMYSLPFMSVIPLSISSPVLGMARGALDGLVGSAVAGERNSNVRGKFADHVLAHSWIGEASAAVDAASLIIFSAVDGLAQLASRGTRLTVDERVRLRRDYAFGVRLCVQAVQALMNCTGASGIMLGEPVQRAWRDINSAARHLGLNWEPYAIQSGRHALGMAPEGLY